jgi:hypothetical protein
MVYFYFCPSRFQVGLRRTSSELLGVAPLIRPAGRVLGNTFAFRSLVRKIGVPSLGRKARQPRRQCGVTEEKKKKKNTSALPRLAAPPRQWLLRLCAVGRHWLLGLTNLAT